MTYKKRSPEETLHPIGRTRLQTSPPLTKNATAKIQQKFSSAKYILITDFVNVERAGKFYLYTITRQLPENVETP